MANQSNSSIHYCLLGTGYFGTRSLRSFIQLLPHVEGGSDRDRPVASIFGVVEKEDSRRDRVKATLQTLALDTGVRYFDNLRSLLDEIARTVTLDPTFGDATFLIHDCSPTELHLRHLIDVSSYLGNIGELTDRVVLLSEKPAITAHQFMTEPAEAIEEALLSASLCDYIETQSLTFIAATGWLAEVEVTPKRHQIWRCGSTGFKKLFEGSREGVTGGALEDKASHDIAVLYGLWGVPSDVTVLSAKVDALVLARHEKFFREQVTTWFTADSTSTDQLADENGQLRSDLADARISASLDWGLPSGERLPVEMTFSWDGVVEMTSLLDDDRVARLDAAGYQVVGFSDRRWHTAKEVRSYEISEARLHLIDFSADQRSGTLALSFLGTKLPGCRSWAVVLWDDGDLEEIPLETAAIGGDNSLLRVLKAICDRENDAVRLLGRDLTKLVGSVCADIRRSVNAGQEAPSDIRAHGVASYDRMVFRSKHATQRRLSNYIFDMDGTLINTPEMDQSFVDPVVAAIAAAGGRSVDQLTDTRDKMMWLAIDHPDFDLNESEREAAMEAFSRLEIGDPELIGLKLYDDVHETLEELRRTNGVRIALLTRGYRKLQSSKILALHLGRYFDAKHIFIDAIDDGYARPGQIGFIRSAAQAWGVQPSQIAIIGDTPEAELAAGIQVGCVTVQVRRGEQAQRGAHREARSLLDAVSQLAV